MVESAPLRNDQATMLREIGKGDPLLGYLQPNLKVKQ
jgi:hypothetical protein